MKKIPLTNGEYALVDDRWYDYLKQWQWSKHQRYAARRVWLNKKESRIFMHHIVLPRKKGFQTDHKDGNGLNNQELNLRYATRNQNMQNAKKRITLSPYKGACWSLQHKAWRVKINVKGKQSHIGCFKNDRHAGLAYALWALDVHGEFANTSFDGSIVAHK
jgi:hypothetical protein